MTPYVVRPGEDLAFLAHTMGFDADSVWNHPDNADLKKLRQVPNILASGDVLYIPESAPKTWFPVTLGVTNAFKATPCVTKLAFTFAHRGNALADTKCIVHGLPDATDFTTDASGTLKLSVPMRTRQIVVEFPSIPLVHTFRIGDLDPLSTESGLRQRLRNLGHHPPHPSDAEIDTSLLATALRGFQKAQGLQVTGSADDDTLHALASTHGS